MSDLEKVAPHSIAMALRKARLQTGSRECVLLGKADWWLCRSKEPHTRLSYHSQNGQQVGSFKRRLALVVIARQDSEDLFPFANIT